MGTSPGSPEGGFNSEFFIQLAFVAFFFLGLFFFHIVLVGLRNKAKVPIDPIVPPYDRAAATQGGVWAAATMGLIALFDYFFG